MIRAPGTLQTQLRCHEPRGSPQHLVLVSSGSITATPVDPEASAPIGASRSLEPRGLSHGAAAGLCTARKPNRRCRGAASGDRRAYVRPSPPLARTSAWALPPAWSSSPRQLGRRRRPHRRGRHLYSRRISGPPNGGPPQLRRSTNISFGPPLIRDLRPPSDQRFLGLRQTGFGAPLSSSPDAAARRSSATTRRTVVGGARSVRGGPGCGHGARPARPVWHRVSNAPTLDLGGDPERFRPPDPGPWVVMATGAHRSRSARSRPSTQAAMPQSTTGTFANRNRVAARRSAWGTADMLTMRLAASRRS